MKNSIIAVLIATTLIFATMAMSAQKARLYYYNYMGKWAYVEIDAGKDYAACGTGSLREPSSVFIEAKKIGEFTLLKDGTISSKYESKQELYGIPK